MIKIINKFKPYCENCPHMDLETTALPLFAGVEQIYVGCSHNALCCGLISRLNQENGEKTIINVNGWRPISEYKNSDYDWVLLKVVAPDGFEWIPYVAEQRRNDGVWHIHTNMITHDDVLCFPEGSKLYFFDMQQLDKEAK